jgi:hypothetical protein
MSEDLSGNSVEDEQDEFEELGCEYCDKEFGSVEERIDHEKKCKAKGVEDKYVKKTKDKKVLTPCHICGTIGHLPVNCSVMRHIR